MIPGNPSRSLEDVHREPERRRQGEHARGEQVERSDHRAEEDGEQQEVDHEHDDADPRQVAQDGVDRVARKRGRAADGYVRVAEPRLARKPRKALLEGAQIPDRRHLERVSGQNDGVAGGGA